MNDEYLLKRLEWMQATITRMASSSFLLKGWAVTITSALLALSAKDSDRTFSLLAIYPTGVFWGLDAYYLQTERKFRAKFEAATKLIEDSLSKSLNSQGSQQAEISQSYAGAFFSRVTWPLYTAIVVMALMITIRVSFK